MNNKTTIATQGRLTAYLIQDQDAQSPQEWGDESLFLIGQHREFFVAPDSKTRNFSVEDEIEKRKDTHHVFPLEAYIHSGVVLALRDSVKAAMFPDRQWDVSLVGVVFVTKSEWKRKDKAQAAAAGLVETWNQYLSGDVWGYTIEDERGECLDSCWGFYGQEYAEQETKNALKYQAGECDKIPTLKAIGVR